MATSHDIVHNLGTTDVHVQLWDLESESDPVLVDGSESNAVVTIVDEDTIHVAVDDPHPEFRVVVLSAGSIGLPSAKGWLTDNADARDYPASAATEDDEFNDLDGMSGPTNGLDAKWSWRNQGAATATFTNPGWLTLNCPAQSSDNHRIIEQDAPAGDFTLETHVSLEGPITNYRSGGLVLVDSTNGDLYRFGLAIEATNSCELTVVRFSSVTSFATEYITRGVPPGMAYYLRVVKSSTTLSFWASADGIGWIRMLSHSDAVGPDKIGLAVNELENDGLTKLHVDYFRVS